MIGNTVTRAICRRDMRRWFGSPTGYVFLTIFVALATVALFWPPAFFQSNLANLDSLNDWFPVLLMFFIPAVTMSVWAGERREGTDELLLTLPASDWQITCGKFLAAAGIYTVSLLFTAPLLVFLAFVGDPDWGLLVANYVGYWLLGLALIAAGMVGSQMSDNLTVAFILGAILCAVVVRTEVFLQKILPTDWARVLSAFGPVSQFQELSRGVLSLSTLLLFVGLIAAFLYLNLVFLSRRRWKEGAGQGVHLSVRFVALLVSVVSLTAVGANAGARGDLTVERLHSLSDETRTLIHEIDPARPVQVQAYVSPSVPADYVQTRRTLLDLLRQYDAMGGDKVMVRIVETDRFSDEAREAENNFGIQARRVQFEEDDGIRDEVIFMGLAFTCGLEEVVIPFLDRGLPVEYELTRSLRVVASAARKKVGILETDLKLFGDFDFQRGRNAPEWEIVRELRLQYDVERVSPDEEYPEDLDVLLVAMGSSLTQDQMSRLESYVLSGHPTLMLDDPFPYVDPSVAPAEPKGGTQNPFQQQGPPPGEKGEFQRLLRNLNINWHYGPGASSPFGPPAGPSPRIVWDAYNPHPQFQFEPEFVFVGANTPGGDAFNQDQAVTAGLQEVVTLFGGAVEPDDDGSDLKFTPLMQTTHQSGLLSHADFIQMNPLFGPSINPARPHREDSQRHVLACRVQGPAQGDATGQVDVIFFSDVDFISQNFFQIRRMGIENMSFDNITLLLNCVDELAGDTSFIELRKRRPRHRTLTRIEDRAREFSEAWLAEKEKAEQNAQADLAEAQARLNERVAAVQDNMELDEQSKAIQVESIRDAEQRMLDVRKAKIEDQKNRALDLALEKKKRGEDRIRDVYRIGSVVITPLPAVLFGIFSLLRRLRREQATTTRKSGGA